ncbi:MAG: NAD(P)-binding domain-containing protein [Polyangiales bacterium]
MSGATNTVGVVGGGRWGLALSCAARRAGRDVVLYSRRGHVEADAHAVEVTTDLGEVARRATLILVAVPSEVVRDVARQLGDHVDGSHLIAHGIRGLSGEGLTPISDVIRAETPCRRVGALGGPAIADDLIEGRPGVIAVGSRYREVTRAVADALWSGSLRVSESDDLVGLEWASALSGGLFVAIGYARAIGVGPALLAGLLTRGVHEAARIAAAAGADERTFFLLPGIGDVMAAMGNDDRPECRLGAALARGKTLDEARAEARLRVEAPELIPRVVAFARAKRLDARVFTVMDAVLRGELDPSGVIERLMRRD